MTEWTIFPSSLEGTITIPPSKSHTLRAIVFAMMGKGKSIIHHPLPSPDTVSMLDAAACFGSHIHKTKNTLEIHGLFSPPKDVIDAGNSGIVLRFIAGLSALLSTYTIITGDLSIRSRRPIHPLLQALEQLGGFAKSARGDGFAPVIIRGPIRPGKCHLNGEDSQPVSALLMATAFLDGISEISVEHPGEKPWIDLTLYWLQKLGAQIEHDDYTHYTVYGGLRFNGFNYTIPGDFSTAAFPIAAALVTQSTLTLEGLDANDIQGDKILISILQKMGAKITWGKSLTIHPSELIGQVIDINACIDALPILAVLGCFAKGTTTLINGAIARHKESDRILAICTELKKMGANIQERPDGLIIHQSNLHGSQVYSHKDHRIALSLIVAALGAKGKTLLVEPEVIAKTYPNFLRDFQHIGAHVELDSIRI